MTPTPRSLVRPLVDRIPRRAAQLGLLSGLTLAGAALALPSGHAAPHVTVAAQTASRPVAVDRASALRASRSRAQLPMKRVLRTTAVGATFSGQASWYGGSFDGQRTANGERFDTSDYTAASRTLPFGTRLRVCHDGCVTVRINDRGPYVDGRILDLSRAAAHAIGFDGVAHVTATPIGERSVSVVDSAALTRRRAHAAKVARSHQLRALALARAEAAQQQQLSTVPRPEGPPRTPLALGGSVLSAASGGVLRLRRRRP